MSDVLKCKARVHEGAYRTIPDSRERNNVQGDKIEIGIAGKPEIQSRDFILKIVIVSA